MAASTIEVPQTLRASCASSLKLHVSSSLKQWARSAHRASRRPCLLGTGGLRLFTAAGDGGEEGGGEGEGKAWWGWGRWGWGVVGVEEQKSVIPNCHGKCSNIINVCLKPKLWQELTLFTIESLPSMNNVFTETYLAVGCK